MASPSELFELELPLPDDRLERIGARLVGFGDRFARLHDQMRLLADPTGLERWGKKHHQGGASLLAALADRYPLVVFHGDVGTGKTATAEAAADALAREMRATGYLLKLSTRVRGAGHVGEMSTLINEAFTHATKLAGRERFVALIVDEGDALAAQRGLDHSHHEDKVGVNTLIQKIDDARSLRGRLLVFLATNRFDALDPAIIRRASLVEEFTRPSPVEREKLLKLDLADLHLTDAQIAQLVALTGIREDRPAWTFSDIRTRLVPTAVATAFPSRALIFDDLVMVANSVEPTPTMVSSR